MGSRFSRLTAPMPMTRNRVTRILSGYQGVRLALQCRCAVDDIFPHHKSCESPKPGPSRSRVTGNKTQFSQFILFCFLQDIELKLMRKIQLGVIKNHWLRYATRHQTPCVRLVFAVASRNGLPAGVLLFVETGLMKPWLARGLVPEFESDIWIAPLCAVKKFRSYQ